MVVTADAAVPQDIVDRHRGRRTASWRGATTSLCSSASSAGLPSRAPGCGLSSLARPRTGGSTRIPRVRPHSPAPASCPAPARAGSGGAVGCQVGRLRALVITEHGPPEVLRVQERPDPEPGPGEVRVAGARPPGINFADLHGARRASTRTRRSRRAWSATRSPARSSRVGEGVEGVEPGERVMGGCRFGGYAELARDRGGRARAAAGRLELRGGGRAARSSTPRRTPAWSATAACAPASACSSTRRPAAWASPPRRSPSSWAPRCSAPHRRRSTTRSASFGVDHPVDYRTQDLVDEIRRITGEKRAARPGHGRGRRQQLQAELRRCCAPAAGSSASAPPRCRPGSGASRARRCEMLAQSRASPAQADAASRRR